MCNEQIRTKIHNSQRKKRLDKCLIYRIKQINEDPCFKTIAACCGHGKLAPTIIVRDFKNSICFEFFTKRVLNNRCKNRKLRKRFYKFNTDLGVYQIDKDIIKENSFFVGEICD